MRQDASVKKTMHAHRTVFALGVCKNHG